jgi:dethiobiotin synthetase
MSGFFVIGTDTGVGKTTVAVGLLAAARARGLRVGCVKPAESGCESRQGELVPADAVLLAKAAGAETALDEVCLYRFEAAVAPGVAAAQEGVEIAFSRIRAAVASALAGKPDLLLVEGAGGLLVPMGGGQLMADLAEVLGLPLLVVGRASLGTINHTLLTAECALERGLAVAGVLLCETVCESGEFVISNAQEIARACAAPVLGVFPHVEEVSIEALASAADTSGVLDAVLGCST